MTHNYHYVTDENKALLEYSEEKNQAKLARLRAESEAKYGDLTVARANAENTLKNQAQTGQSEREVRSILGSPDRTHSNDVAEFWVYDDLVLTMKNGYVFDVTRSPE